MQRMNTMSGFTSRPYRYMPRLAMTMSPASSATRPPPRMKPSRAVTAAMPTAASAGPTRAAASPTPAAANAPAMIQ